MDGSNRRQLAAWLFVAYCLMMLWLLFLHRIGTGPGAWQFNLRPLDTVRRYLWVLRHSTDAAQRSNATANLFGNVALFVPLGIFLPMLFDGLRKLWRFGLLTVALILLLELTQAATGLGTCDIDDLILNLAGTALGYLLWHCLRR